MFFVWSKSQGLGREEGWIIRPRPALHYEARTKSSAPEQPYDRLVPRHLLKQL